MDVIYEDNHLLVVYKRAGIATEGSPSLEEEAKRWLKDVYHKPGNVFLRHVHRLDKWASGIVIFAKTSKALQRLQKSFRQRLVHKMYQVLVEGYVYPKEGSMEDFLVKESFRAVVSVKHEQAKAASLSYKVIKYQADMSLVEVVLHTGRYHQIRVQFSSRGHPIVNDTKYGAKKAQDSQEIALCHVQIRVAHPITGKTMTFERM